MLCAVACRFSCRFNIVRVTRPRCLLAHVFSRFLLILLFYFLIGGIVPLGRPATCKKEPFFQVVADSGQVPDSLRTPNLWSIEGDALDAASVQGSDMFHF